jgi:hypothetical protein
MQLDSSVYAPPNRHKEVASAGWKSKLIFSDYIVGVVANNVYVLKLNLTTCFVGYCRLISFFICYGFNLYGFL